MARNEEKHYGKLNRLYLAKEKEEYEKANPKRPRLDILNTAEEIQKWLPSIKKEIDFYLKKSQVTCYSDAHIEECQVKLLKLEKEFKAFVRKMKQLSSAPFEAIPWTNRPYKRRKSFDSEDSPCKEFKHIATPILDEEENNSSNKAPALQSLEMNCDMDQPLIFTQVYSSYNKTKEEKEIPSEPCLTDSNGENCDKYVPSRTQITNRESLGNCKDCELKQSIVNYDSSDSETT